MTDYKVMFWNIQNIYEQKAVTPDELGLETGQPAKIQRLLKNSTKLYKTNDIDYRALVANIVVDVDPDILLVVEISVGKQDLQSGGRVVGSAASYDNFSVYNLLVTLNAKYALATGAAATFASASSLVNSSDLTPMTQASGISLSGSRNTMFEQYAVLWKQAKFTPVQPASGPPVELLTKDAAGAKLPFAQRYPGGIALTETAASAGRVYVVMNHSVWGSAVGPRVQAIASLARVDRVTQEPNLVVAGDFNVDYIASSASYAPLVAVAPNVRNGNGPTSRVSAGGTSLKNAYDQVFNTQTVQPASPVQGVYDIVTGPCSGNWDVARRISDHLPVFANFSLP